MTYPIFEKVMKDGKVVKYHVLPSGEFRPVPVQRDYWETPQEIVEEGSYLLNFVPLIDAAATAENSKCVHFISEEMDALETDWVEYAKSLGLKPHFFLNPPYSKGLINLFMMKAFTEARKGASVMCLIPPSVSSSWWHDSVEVARDLGMLTQKNRRGRINYIPPPGVEESSARGDATFVLFRPNPAIKLFKKVNHNLDATNSLIGSITVLKDLKGDRE